MTKSIPALDNRALNYLHVPNDPIAHQEISDIWEEAVCLTEPSQWCHVLSKEEFISCFYPFAVESRSVTRLIENSRKVWLLAASIGGLLEARAKEYLSRRIAYRGFMLDRIGSYFVEYQVANLSKKIDMNSVEQGFETTRRFSPGYHDFSISAQEIFLNIIGGAMKLRLTESCIILPEKTVTAIKGVLIPGL
jgi:hypothetical protein